MTFDLKNQHTAEAPVGNVILSFNKQALRGFDKSNISIGGLLAGRRQGENDTFVFRSQDDNLLNFTHEYAAGEDGGGNATVTLEIIDPDQTFEFRVAELSSKLYNNYLAQRADEIRQRDEYIAGLEKEIQDIAASALDFEQNPTFTDDEQETIDKLQTLFVPSDETGPRLPLDFDPVIIGPKIKDALDKIDALELSIQDIKQKIDSADKGYSSLVDSWIMYGCGDNTASWAGPFFMRLTGSEYAYTATGIRKLVLIFTSNNSPYNDFFDNRGFGLVAQSNKVRFGRIEYTPDSMRFNVSYQREAAIKTEYPLDLNDVITRVLTSYLRKVTAQSNVIVAFPDMNLSLDLTLQSWLDSLDSISGDYPKLKQQEAYSRMFAELGLDVVSDQLYTSQISSANNRGGRPRPESKYESLSFNLGPIKFDHSVQLTCGAEEKFSEPLVRFFNFWTQNSIFPTKWALFWENDTELLKVWYKYLPDLVIDPSQPVCVFGHRDFIDRFLYARKHLETAGLRLRDPVGSVIPSGLELLAAQNNKTNVITLDSALPDQLDKTGFHEGIFNANFQQDVFDVLYDADFIKCFDAQNVGFDVGGLDQEEITRQLILASIPVFKSGVKNSNILSMSIKGNNQYLNILQNISVIPDTSYHEGHVGIDPDLLRPSADIYEKITADHVDMIASFIDATDDAQRKEILDLLSAQLGLPATIATAKKTDVTRFLLNVVLGGLNSHSPDLLIDPTKGSVGMANLMNMADFLVNSSRSGSIRTLPLFYLSRAAIPYPAMLYILENRVQGVDDNGSPLNATYSGWWTIIGWKHRISPQAVDSTFTIVQDAGNTKPQNMEAIVGLKNNGGDNPNLVERLRNLYEGTYRPSEQDKPEEEPSLINSIFGAIF